MLALLRRYLLSIKGRCLFGRSVAVFGNFTVVHPENVRLGANCAINHDVFILGRCSIEIEDDVVLSARAMLIDAGLDPSTFLDPRFRKYADGPIRIGRGAWIGAAAIILPGISVGERSIIGAGAIVTRDVPPLSIAAGNPARVIGRVNEDRTA